MSTTKGCMGSSRGLPNLLGPGPVPHPWSSPIKMWLLQFGLYSPQSLLSADGPPSLRHSLKIQSLPDNGPAIGRAWAPCLFPPCQHLRQEGFASLASTEAGVGVGGNGRQHPRVTPVQRPHSSLLMRCHCGES